MSHPELHTADLEWTAEGAPRSQRFGDIYFSGDGAAETEHVFLAGNDLPARFVNAERFSIGELGFGSGLNFLAAWDAWRRAKKPAGAQLRFLSYEAYPLTPHDLEKVLSSTPRFHSLGERLLDCYPPLSRGFHERQIDEGVFLTLYLGDAEWGLGQTDAQIDAWFFDGFAPRTNPAMWSEKIFRNAARLSAPGATMATFSVSGMVRRNAEQAGFHVTKRPGYGRKRDMLAGVLKSPINQPSPRQPWYETANPKIGALGARIAIIGAGIAGASLAYALCRRGFKPVLYERAAPANGASGNPVGLIMPRLDADDAPPARFHLAAYLHTIRLLRDLTAMKPAFQACGAFLHAQTDHDRARFDKICALNALPPDWLQRRDEALYFPQAGVVDPRAYVRALIGDIQVKIANVHRLEEASDGWRVEMADAKKSTYDAVIIANGLDALRLLQCRTLPLSGAAGQLDIFPNAASPNAAHVFGPYAAPAPQGGLAAGATYAPIAIGAMPQFTREATETNIAALQRTMPDYAAGLRPDQSQPRASVRCTTPDQLPVVGQLPDWAFYAGAYDGLRLGRQDAYPLGRGQNGLFILAGLGSRGLVTAPLAAAAIADALAGAPSPFARDVRDALHPARFAIRDLRRAVRLRKEQPLG